MSEAARSEDFIAPTEPLSFQAYLQTELVRRCRANPRYSLRAFARSMAIEPSLLSKLLSGKRRMTIRMFDRLSKQLGLSADRIKTLKMNLLEETRPSSQPHYEQVSSDAFSLIAEWYHYAILELIQLKDFKSDLRWIARRLDISHAEVKDAVERLQRLSFIEVSEDGEIRPVSGNHTTVGSIETSTALRMFQRKALQLAASALDQVPADLRDHTSMTMAIALEDIPKAKALIKQFRRGLCRKLQQRKDFDEVFQLSISFYPLTKISRTIERE